MSLKNEREKSNYLSKLNEVLKVCEFLKLQGFETFDESTREGATMRAAARGSLHNIALTSEEINQHYFTGKLQEEKISFALQASEEIDNDYVGLNNRPLWNIMTEDIPELINTIRSELEG